MLFASHLLFILFSIPPFQHSTSSLLRFPPTTDESPRHATLPLPILILNFLFLFLVRINESMNQRHYDITNLATPPQIQARREQVHSTNHDPRTTQPHNHAFFSLLPVFFSIMQIELDLYVRTYDMYAHANLWLLFLPNT